MTTSTGQSPRNSGLGAAGAANNLHLHREVFDAAALRGVAQVLDQPALEKAIAGALEKAGSAHRADGDRRAAIERELVHVTERLGRLVEAIKRGEAIDSLVTALKDEEARRAALEQELAGLGSTARITSLDSKRLEKLLRAAASDVRTSGGSWITRRQRPGPYSRRS